MEKLNGFGFTNSEWQTIRDLGHASDIAKEIRSGKSRDKALENLYCNYKSLYDQLKIKGKNDYELLDKINKLEIIKNTWH